MVKEETMTPEEALANCQSVISMYEGKLSAQFARATNLMGTAPNSTEATVAFQEYQNLNTHLNTLRTMRASFEESISQRRTPSLTPPVQPSVNSPANNAYQNDAQVQTAPAISSTQQQPLINQHSLVQSITPTVPAAEGIFSPKDGLTPAAATISTFPQSTPLTTPATIVPLKTETQQSLPNQPDETIPMETVVKTDESSPIGTKPTKIESDRQREQPVSGGLQQAAQLFGSEWPRRQLAKRSTPFPRSSPSSSPVSSLSTSPSSSPPPPSLSPLKTESSRSSVKIVDDRSIMALPTLSKGNAKPLVLATNSDSNTTTATTTATSSSSSSPDNNNATTAVVADVCKYVEPFLFLGEHYDVSEAANKFCNTFEAVLKESGLSANRKPSLPEAASLPLSERKQQQNWENLLEELLKRNTGTCSYQQRVWFDIQILGLGISWWEARARILRRYEATPEQDDPVSIEELTDLKQRANETHLEYVIRWLNYFKRSNLSDSRYITMQFIKSLREGSLEKLKGTVKHFHVFESLYNAMDHVLSMNQDELKNLVLSLDCRKGNRINYSNNNNNSISNSSSNGGNVGHGLKRVAKEVVHKDPRGLTKKKRGGKKGGRRAPYPCAYCGEKWSPVHTCLAYIDAKKRQAAERERKLDERRQKYQQ